MPGAPPGGGSDAWPFWDIRGYATFADAIAAIGAVETTLAIADEYPVIANITVPGNITLFFAEGGSLNIGPGITVKIEGNVIAGFYRIFLGLGTVQFGAAVGTGSGTSVLGTSGISGVYPEWWGAKGDGGTSSAAAIQKAIDTHIPVYLEGSKAQYLVETTIRFGVYDFRFHGQNAVLKLKSAANCDILAVSAGYSGVIEDLILTGNKANNASGRGVVVDRGLLLTFNNVQILDTKDYGMEINTTDADTTTTFLNRCYFNGMVNGLVLDIKATANVFRGVHVRDTVMESISGDAVTLTGYISAFSFKKGYLGGIGGSCFKSTNASPKYLYHLNISDNISETITGDFINLPTAKYSIFNNNDRVRPIVLTDIPNEIDGHRTMLSFAPGDTTPSVLWGRLSQRLMWGQRRLLFSMMGLQGKKYPLYSGMV